MASRMVQIVGTDWVEKNIGSAEVLVLDPRRPMKYLQGHICGAVNLPIRAAFDDAMRLKPEDALASWLGAAGLSDGIVPVVYDSYDGQNGSMLVWLLEYLGCKDVRLMAAFFEQWVREGREIFYRPVEARPRKFRAQLNPTVRATTEDLQGCVGFKLVDLRSTEEYSGAKDTDGMPGHIPKAVNLPWTKLVDAERGFCVSPEKLKELAARADIRPEDRVVAYCRVGMRAAVGYLAFQRIGIDTRLYDGSYAEWVRRGLPVEA